MHLTMGGPVPETLLAQMSEILAANTMRKTNTSPGELPWLPILHIQRLEQVVFSKQQTPCARRIPHQVNIRHLRQVVTPLIH
jgi:hypothetical protein